MTNKEIVELLPQLEKFEKQLSAYKATWKRIEDKIHTVSAIIRELQNVTEVFEGVALHVTVEHSTYVYLVGNDEKYRAGEVYPNARVKGYFGINLRNHEEYRQGGSCKGFAWPDYHDALVIVKQWVAHGIDIDKSDEKWDFKQEK